MPPLIYLFFTAEVPCNMHVMRI